MKIIAGPYACGKTHLLTTLIERSAKPARLIVPTSTLAARMPGAITLSQLVSRIVPELTTPSEAALDREIRHALTTLDLPPLRGVRAFEGLRRTLRGLLEEISTPGVSAAEFADALRRVPYASAMQRAIAAVYARVEQTLGERGQALAGTRVRLAAERMLKGRAPASDFFFDGFYSFSDAELDLIDALAGSTEVTLTVPIDWPDASRTMARFADRADIETLPGLLFQPRIEKFSATSKVQECEEIARRIRARLAEGERASTLGVIVRQAAIYLPLLRSAFARYGVPATFYFAEPLERQRVARFYASVVDSLLDGWNVERIRQAIALPVSGLGATPDGDRLDLEIRKRIPGRGFDGLPALEERFGRFSEWMTALRTPQEWAAALPTLLESSAPDTWSQAVLEAASALPDRECTLAQFWPEVVQTVRSTVVRNVRPTEDAVVVIDAFEARQWRFHAAYVCGLLEGEFPSNPVGDAFFDDGARRELARLGVPMRTSEILDAEERALVEVTATRANQVTFSWPAVTSGGEESLPSFALETFPGDIVAARPAPPDLPTAYRPPSRTTTVSSDAIQRFIAPEKTWRPTEIECFLQCPFQYLGRYTLKLQPPPPIPAERFDARAQGSLAHKILRRVSENPSLDVAAVLDEELRLLAGKEHIPDSHVTLWRRTAMLRVLRQFLQTPPERQEWHREYEWPFEFDLVQGARIKGRIDRFDSKDGRAFAIDYKYSKATRLRKSDAVQGGLYLLGLRAAGFVPAGFAYVALREDGAPVLYDAQPLMDDVREQTISVVASVAEGDVSVRPSDPSLCRFCEFLPACRISQAAGAAFAGSEGGE